jgi:Dyp-type peroxidase family
VSIFPAPAIPSILKTWITCPICAGKGGCGFWPSFGLIYYLVGKKKPSLAKINSWKKIRIQGNRADFFANKNVSGNSSAITATKISMPLLLNSTLKAEDPSPDVAKSLQNLQGNILKGHGRDFTANVFFRLADDAAKSCRLLRKLGNFHITSAHAQLEATKKFKAHAIPGPRFAALFLTVSAYRKIGTSEAGIPADRFFRNGMKHGGRAKTKTGLFEPLQDPVVEEWEEGLQQDADGMLLLADDDEGVLGAYVAEIRELLDEHEAEILCTINGKALKNAVGKGIEHFGYVDGRSQPLVLEEDIAREGATAGTTQWDPAAALSIALVPDKAAGGASALSYGSYFIFRKLEQRVRAFKIREQELASALRLQGGDRELAGAYVVGRFEDGTPVTLSDAALGTEPGNNFNYAGDVSQRCPFHAHIRKVNPRDPALAPLNARGLLTEDSHLMLRRGIPFEDKVRKVHPEAVPEFEHAEGASQEDILALYHDKIAPLLPEDGVGLLFMAYNADLAKQFVFTQQSWANDGNFPPAPSPPGIDPLIGQGPLPLAPAGDSPYPKAWDDPAAGFCPFAFRDFVKMKGGEYFFAPSLKFLKECAANAPRAHNAGPRRSRKPVDPKNSK